MNKILKILGKVSAILVDDHFVYTSGQHGSVYVNKDALYPHTRETSLVGKMIASRFVEMGVEVVVAPALGGIILSQWTANHLSKLTGREVLGIYTEKTVDKGQDFTRGYDKLVDGKKVLVVEDITTTGGSLMKTIQSVKMAGGKVVAACSMINRDPNGVTSNMFGVPFSALGEFRTEAFDVDSCPLCLAKIPINTSVGHGKI